MPARWRARRSRSSLAAATCATRAAGTASLRPRAPSSARCPSIRSSPSSTTLLEPSPAARTTSSRASSGRETLTRRCANGARRGKRRWPSAARCALGLRLARAERAPAHLRRPFGVQRIASGNSEAQALREALAAEGDDYYLKEDGDDERVVEVTDGAGPSGA